MSSLIVVSLLHYATGASPISSNTVVSLHHCSHAPVNTDPATHHKSHSCQILVMSVSVTLYSVEKRRTTEHKLRPHPATSAAAHNVQSHFTWQLLGPMAACPKSSTRVVRCASPHYASSRCRCVGVEVRPPAVRARHPVAALLCVRVGGRAPVWVKWGVGGGVGMGSTNTNARM